jgi:hypothetical protein
MPAPALPSFSIPLINGNAVSWASLSIQVGQLKTIGCKAVNYKDSLKPGKGRGTNSQVIMRSRGNYDAEGSITFYKAQWLDVLAYLQTLSSSSGLSTTGGPPGFKEVSWALAVSYSETPVSPVQTDTCFGCRITETEEDGSEGEELTVVKCALDIQMISWAGAFSLNNPLGFQ